MDKDKSWKTTFGGALSSMGTTLIGVGLVPQMKGVQSDFLTNVTIAGFLCQAAGQFFSNLFAADKSSVDRIQQTVNDIKNGHGPNI